MRHRHARRPRIAGVSATTIGLALAASLAVHGCAHREPGGQPTGEAPAPVVAPASTAHPNAPAAAEAIGHPLGLKEAAQLVHDLIRQEHPTADSDVVAAVGVTEIRVPELWERMRMQAFDVQDDLWNAQYVVRDGKAVQLGRSVGGPGVTSIHVCDLDGDGEPELAYSCRWGSGLSRTDIAVFSGPGLPGEDQPALSFASVELTLRKQDDRTVLVYEGDRLVGTLRRESTAHGPKPGIDFAKDAPSDVNPWAMPER